MPRESIYEVLNDDTLTPGEKISELNNMFYFDEMTPKMRDEIVEIVMESMNKKHTAYPKPEPTGDELVDRLNGVYQPKEPEEEISEEERDEIDEEIDDYFKKYCDVYARGFQAPCEETVDEDDLSESLVDSEDEELPEVYNDEERCRVSVDIDDLEDEDTKWCKPFEELKSNISEINQTAKNFTGETVDIMSELRTPIAMANYLVDRIESDFKELKKILRILKKSTRL